MGYRWIVTSFASVILIALAAGCASQTTREASNGADPAAAVTASQLSGTWRGEMWPIGTDSTSVQNRDAMLEIKDDASYRLILSRQVMGPTGTNDSGTATGDRRTVVLRSSAGQVIRLQRNGDRLYGVVNSGGRPMHIMMERVP